MAKDFARSRASPLVSIMALAQLQSTWAMPLRAPFSNTTSTPESSVASAQGVLSSSSVILSATQAKAWSSTTCTETDSNGQPTGVVGQISDGQVQASAATFKGDITLDVTPSAFPTTFGISIPDISTLIPDISSLIPDITLPSDITPSAFPTTFGISTPDVSTLIPDITLPSSITPSAFPTTFGLTTVDSTFTPDITLPSSITPPAFQTTFYTPLTSATESNVASVTDAPSSDVFSSWIWGTSVGPYETETETSAEPTPQDSSVVAASHATSTRTSTIMSTITVSASSGSASAVNGASSTTDYVSIPDITIPAISDLTSMSIPDLTAIPTAITIGSSMTISIPGMTIQTIPDNSLTSLTTSAVQTVTTSLSVSNTGSVNTGLETTGESSVNPFPTVIPTSATSLSLLDPSSLAHPTTTEAPTGISASNIFQRIATGAPPAQISSRGDHPVPRLGIQSQQGSLQTNKFYANLFLGSQSQPAWTHPYSVNWAKGGGATDSWGLSVSHVERSQLANGPPQQGKDAGEWSYFANPLGVQSLVLSAAELGEGTTLTTDSLEAASVNVNLVAKGANSPVVTFPLVQGMGFVTGVYKSGTPLVQSGVGIKKLTYSGAVMNMTTYKYTAQLQNGYTWLMYVTPQNKNYKTNSFQLVNSGLVQGPSGFGGYIQVAKVPANTDDAAKVYDRSAGAYASASDVSGTADGTKGSYSFSWKKQGVSSQKLLMFALPHHMETMAVGTSNSSASIATDIKLQTTTKGMATAIQGDSWTLTEPNMPVSMGFGPWNNGPGTSKIVSKAAISTINRVGTSELSQNIGQQTDVGSLYFDGKALAKFAAVCYTLHDIGGNASLGLTGLQTLKTAMDFHVSNKMPTPIVYDSAWGGAVSSGSYTTGNSGADFGNTYYNDHHFHYGYFVYTAAVIGYLDPDWLNTGTNKQWVNMLVRDYANSVTDDQYYPFSRMFDWYHGHSWAHGIIETADGKDQESSSEDTMASYAIKMWGQTVGDTNMEARGNLMLAVQRRSLNHYFLYMNNNTDQPSQFIGNKASGIVFENKIDHTTYFGAEPEYIQGIHMLPIMPFSTYTRPTEFVKQEWNTYFGDNGVKPANTVSGGWRGVLMANYALVDPSGAYDFFSNSTGAFNIDMLDGGASQTWYLAMAAGLGGGGSTSAVSTRDTDNDYPSEEQAAQAAVSEMVSIPDTIISKRLAAASDDNASVNDTTLPENADDAMSPVSLAQTNDVLAAAKANAHAMEQMLAPTRKFLERSSRLRQRMSGAIIRGNRSV